MHPIATKYVRKFPSGELSGSSSSRIVVPVSQANVERLELSGLSQLANIGDRILPAPIGPATRRNVNGRIVILRDQPKEVYSWEVLWAREQFCGRGETEWVEDYVTRTCKRYPRLQIEPENIEVSLIENARGERLFATDVLDHRNADRWIVAANIMLEINGLAWVVSPEEVDLPLVETRRVNWTILPPGTSWTELKPMLDATVDRLRSEMHRTVARRKLGELYQFGPDFVVVGQGGFNRYVGLVFQSRGFVVLESVEPYNATYVLGMDWARISQMSKGEILSDNLHLARIIHGKTWRQKLEAWFQNHAA